MIISCYHLVDSTEAKETDFFFSNPNRIFIELELHPIGSCSCPTTKFTHCSFSGSNLGVGGACGYTGLAWALIAIGGLLGGLLLAGILVALFKYINMRKQMQQGYQSIGETSNA